MARIPEIVYLLCALTSLVCVILLARGYFRTRARILLWSTLCFVFLALNNVLLYVDLALYGDKADLSMFRDLTALIAASVMVFGLIWDTD